MASGWTGGGSVRRATSHIAAPDDSECRSAECEADAEEKKEKVVADAG